MSGEYRHSKSIFTERSYRVPDTFGKSLLRMKTTGFLALSLSILVVADWGLSQAKLPPEQWPPIATFSILGYDPATGEVRGAVQSRVVAVGYGVVCAEGSASVAAAQAVDQV